MAGHGAAAAAAPPAEVDAQDAREEANRIRSFHALFVGDIGDNVSSYAYTSMRQLSDAEMRGVVRKFGEQLFNVRAPFTAHTVQRLSWLVRFSDVAAEEAFALDDLLPQIVQLIDERNDHTRDIVDELCGLVGAFVASSSTRAATIAAHPKMLAGIVSCAGRGSLFAIGALAAAGYAVEVDATGITAHLAARSHCIWSSTALLCIAAEIPAVHDMHLVTVDTSDILSCVATIVNNPAGHDDAAHLLVKMGGAKALRLFHARGGNVDNAHRGSTVIAKTSNTPAHLAARCGYVATLEVLKELGADFAAKTDGGETVADVARDDDVRFVCESGRRTKRAHDV